MRLVFALLFSIFLSAGCRTAASGSQTKDADSADTSGQGDLANAPQSQQAGLADQCAADTDCTKGKICTSSCPQFAHFSHNICLPKPSSQGGNWNECSGDSDCSAGEACRSSCPAAAHCIFQHNICMKAPTPPGAVANECSSDANCSQGQKCLSSCPVGAHCFFQHNICK